MPEKYDVIIIGAGIGGLTSGAILSRNGKKVLILEKNPVPGGYAVNFRRGEFEFDASIHLVNGFDSGQTGNKILELCGISERVKFLKPKYLFRSVFPNIDIRIPQGNLKEYINILTRHFPKEKDGLERLFKLMSKLYCRIEDVGEASDKISPAEFTEYVNKTYQEVLEQFLKDRKLMALVSQLWSYYGLSPRRLSAIFFCYPWYDYVCNKGFYLKGGARALSAELKTIIQKNGGELKFNTKVIKILLKENIVYGITTEKGEEFFARSIVSNIDARTTFYNLVGEKYLQPSFLDKISKMEPSLSAFQVYLGLNVDLKNIGIDDYVIFVNPDFDLDKQFNAYLNNDINNSAFGLTLYSMLEENFAPKSKSAMAIITLAGYDFWKNLSKEEYKKQKKHFTDILIKRTEAIIPNLSSHIEIVESATPLTMERYTGNYKGAIYGWSQTVSQSGSNRLKNKTPIKNLYLVGAWTLPGGGIKGVMQSGVIVSNKILNGDF